MTIFTIQKQLQSVGMNKMVKDKKIDNFIIYNHKFNNYHLLNSAMLIIYINSFV